jgi:hypothetical protein
MKMDQRMCLKPEMRQLPYSWPEQCQFPSMPLYGENRCHVPQHMYFTVKPTGALKAVWYLDELALLMNGVLWMGCS